MLVEEVTIHSFNSCTSNLNPDGVDAVANNGVNNSNVIRNNAAGLRRKGNDIDIGVDDKGACQ